MIDVRRRDDGHEEMNLPVEETIDNKVYREAYRDLIRSKLCKDVTYTKFLMRMRERNVASRKMEFERRKVILNERTAPNAWKAYKEAINAGNPGKIKGE